MWDWDRKAQEGFKIFIGQTEQMVSDLQCFFILEVTSSSEGSIRNSLSKIVLIGFWFQSWKR